MPTPPRATAVWKSTSRSVTSPRGVDPSNVAALTIRLRRVSGPSRAGANGSGGMIRTVPDGSSDSGVSFAGEGRTGQSSRQGRRQDGGQQVVHADRPEGR